MIDKCDPDVACWSESGDNFIVKDVDKFSSVSNDMLIAVIPLMIAPSTTCLLPFYSIRRCFACILNIAILVRSPDR